MIPNHCFTCGRWSTVSVLYDESGHYIGLFKLDKAPIYTIIDPVLIATAPLLVIRRVWVTRWRNCMSIADYLVANPTSLKYGCLYAKQTVLPTD